MKLLCWSPTSIYLSVFLLSHLGVLSSSIRVRAKQPWPSKSPSSPGASVTAWRARAQAASPKQEIVSFSSSSHHPGCRKLWWLYLIAEVPGCKVICSNVSISIFQFLLGKSCLRVWERLGFCYRPGSGYILSTNCKYVNTPFLNPVNEAWTNRGIAMNSKDSTLGF